jgi:hypothetical protein
MKKAAMKKAKAQKAVIKQKKVQSKPKGNPLKSLGIDNPPKKKI